MGVLCQSDDFKIGESEKLLESLPSPASRPRFEPSATKAKSSAEISHLSETQD